MWSNLSPASGQTGRTRCQKVKRLEREKIKLSKYNPALTPRPCKLYTEDPECALK